MKLNLMLGLALLLGGEWSLYGDEIHEAAAHGDLAKIKELVKNNPNLVSSKNRDGETPLLWAVSSDQKNVVEYLLANKADVNDPGGIPNNPGIPGITPLHEAARLGRKDMAELLLAHNADVGGKDHLGSTPLHYAAGGNHTDVIEVLVAHKGDVNARDKIGQTPLHDAAMDGRREAVALLLTNHAVINAKDNSGMTPLFWAVYQGHKEVAELLLASKAEVNVTDNSGHTALHYAASKGFPEIVQLLLTNRANVNGDGALISKALQPASKSDALSGDPPSSKGPPTKEDMAVRILKSHQDLADKGDAYGELRMGQRYRDGDGVPKDLVKAREWLQKAADQGQPDAAKALALLPQPRPTSLSGPTNPVSIDTDIALASAEFGMGQQVADVTVRVGELLRSQPAGFTIDGKTLGVDPMPGKKKRLVVKYTYRGTQAVLVVQGGKHLGKEALVKNASE